MSHPVNDSFYESLNEAKQEKIKDNTDFIEYVIKETYGKDQRKRHDGRNRA